MGGLSTEYKVKNKKEGIEKLKDVISSFTTSDGTSWAILMEQKDGLRVFSRTQQPCLGEMRPYGKDCSRPNDRRPGDLRTPFPDGTPLAIGKRIGSDYGQNRKVTDLEDFIYSQEGPWRRALKKFEIFGKRRSIVVTDLEVSPTLLVNLFLNDRNFGDSHDKLFQEIVKETKNPYLAIFFLLYTSCYSLPITYPVNLLQSGRAYVFANNNPVEAFVEGRPDKEICKVLFSDRGAYNRPDVQNVFGYGPVFCKDFPPELKQMTNANYKQVLEHMKGLL